MGRGLRARLLALLLACACSGDAERDAGTTLEFWGLGREGELVRELVPEFERRHPGLRVRVQQIPWSAAHEKLLTAFAGGALPDAIQVGSTWIPELVALGALEPLDARIAASADVRADDTFPGLLEMGAVGDATWAVPWYADTRLLFYRRDLFAQAGSARPPRSWSEWRASLEAVRRVLPASSHPILLPLGEWELPVVLAFQRGASLLRDGDRHGNFASPEFRAAFDFYLGFFRDGLAPRRGAAELGNLYQDFAAGSFASFVSGPWSLGELARRLPLELQDRWATAPLPAPDGDGPGVSLAGGAGLAIVAGSPRRDAAWRWIEFLASPEQQAAFHALSGDLPARRSAWRDPRLAGSPPAQAFRAQLEAIRPTPKIPEWERIAARIARHAEAVVRGSEGADRALRTLDHEADQVLEKRRWLLTRKRSAQRAEGERSPEPERERRASARPGEGKRSAQRAEGEQGGR